MPRDYKNAGSRRKREPTAPGWVWLLAGLLIGLFIALLVFLHQHAPGKSARVTETRAARAPVRAPNPPVKAAPTKSASKPAPDTPRKPKFDFYTILPEMEVMVPEEDIHGKPEHGVAQVDKPGTYVLQAGSFRQYQQADHLKAKLALLGLEANIESVTVNGDETWHRVRLGPYRSLSRLNHAREVLRSHDIEALLLKLKG